MVPIKYNLRNLAVRKRNTLAAAFGLALVVWVFASAQMLSTGLAKTFTRNSNKNVIVVVRKGATNEIQSSISAPDAKIAISQAEQVGASAKPAGVAELSVVILLPKADGAGEGNVPVRGTTEDSFKFRPTVKVIAGVMPKPGTDEVIVGAGIHRRFQGLDIGQTFALRKNRPVKVVGVFSDAGSAYESEVWADLETVQQSFGRAGGLTTVRVRLDKAESFQTYKSVIEGDKRLQLIATPEPDFLSKESRGTVATLGFVGNLIAFFFALGAMIGATITMNAQVAGRTREIGTLRALGFSRSQILFSFLLESLVLALAGGAIGAVAAVAMSAIKVEMTNQGTWAQVVFGFEPTPQIVISSLVAASFMGLMGGFLPAIRAARVLPIQAMRE